MSKIVATVPVTRCNSKLLKTWGPTTSRARYKFLSDNCVKLAQFLTDLPPKHHYQASWTNAGNNACGTTGCALGWAALSHIIPGLQFVYTSDYGYRREDQTHHDPHNIQPAINGEVSNWREAGYMFFGEDVFENVFGPYGSKVEVINKLYRHAEEYCELAKGKPA